MLIYNKEQINSDVSISHTPTRERHKLSEKNKLFLSSLGLKVIK